MGDEIVLKGAAVGAVLAAGAAGVAFNCPDNVKIVVAGVAAVGAVAGAVWTILIAKTTVSNAQH